MLCARLLLHSFSRQEYADDPQPMSLPSQYPWSFVSAQLTNAKGNEIFYPVIDDRPSAAARRAATAPPADQCV
jgi:hypothetical protein